MWEYKYHRDIHGIVAHYIKVNNIKCKYYGFMCKSDNCCWGKIDGKDIFFNINTYKQVDHDTFMRDVVNEINQTESKYENYTEYLYLW